MLRLLASLVLFLALAAPAAAHKLRLFATVDGDAVTGYAFFVGGGRAAGTGWSAEDATGAVLASGTTDGDGRYRFTPPAPVTDAITVSVDTGEGHVATATIAPERFDGAVATVPAPAAASLAQPRAADPDAVARAVRHEITPLLERIEEMEARMRLTDLMSGLFLIIGLAGIALYIRGLRK